MSSAWTVPTIGDVVGGKFRIERKLAEGGTSTIYEVRHAITDKKFAIKWLAPELAQNTQAVERFIDEAKICGRYEHPNAVQIYDIARSRESFYLLMEFLEGESLDERLARVGRLSVQAACDILIPCAEALQAAHRIGIVHRDLKPSNIFLCRAEGRRGEVPKVLDFGISKLSHNGYDLSLATTTSRTVIGTPQYMSPEQMRGQPADPRFDVYALGVVLYEAVSGQLPFDCDNFADLVFKIIETQPARLDAIAEVEPAFAELVERAMARKAETRFASMAELALALAPYSSGLSEDTPITHVRRRAEPTAKCEPPAEVVMQPLAAVSEPVVAEEAPLPAVPRFARTRELRGLAVIAALAVALTVAWRVREGAPRDNSLRPKVQVASQLPVAPAPPPVKAPSPPAAAPPEPPVVTQPTAAAIERPVRRPRKPRAAKLEPVPRAALPATPKATLERGDFRSDKPHLSLPPAEISRGDF
ncbi:MAG TPA: serine/threonine-protein kinase [Polyangiales bacterium]|nr:serine/threonine-protein kinase [Polyangiales bacterium]